MGKKNDSHLLWLYQKPTFTVEFPVGADIKYPALNYEIAWIMNVALKCSPLPPWWWNNLRWIHQSDSCQRSGLPSEVAVLSSGTRFSCCTGRLVKTDGKLDSWVCLSGLPRGLLFPQFSKTTSLVQYVFYIFGFTGHNACNFILFSLIPAWVWSEEVCLVPRPLFIFSRFWNGDGSQGRISVF